MEDAKQWYAGVQITGTGDISESALEKAISILKTVKVIVIITIIIFFYFIIIIIFYLFVHYFKVVGEESKVGVKELIDPNFAHLRHDIKSMKLYKRPELINYVSTLFHFFFLSSVLLLLFY